MSAYQFGAYMTTHEDGVTFAAIPPPPRSNTVAGQDHCGHLQGGSLRDVGRGQRCVPEFWA
jgi:hypothetical protein